MFSVLSWNVEHFKDGTARVKDVAKHIRDQNPDIFGVFEVEGGDVQDLMQNQFPKYDFNITDGPQQMETIVAHRRGKFSQVVFTQKREFKLYNPQLRPGALLSALLGSDFYNILFLHTDSGTEAPDFGNRQEMFEKIASVKKGLDKLAQGDSRLIALGDFNTMGLFFPTRRKSDGRVTAEEEVSALDAAGHKVKMSILPKDFSETYFNGTLKSNLDQVIASDNLQITAPVAVRGWQQLAGTARQKFIENVSDHCSLLVEVPT